MPGYLFLILIIAALVKCQTKLLERLFVALISAVALSTFFFFLFGTEFNSGSISARFIYALSLLLSIALSYGFRSRASESGIRQELIYCAVFLVALVSLHRLSLRWPDFFSMGERLRDFAVLGAVIKSPYPALEPWLPTLELNYYLLWYRLGALISSLTGMEVYDSYHFLVSLPLALYFSLAFVILHRDLSQTLSTALTIALAIAFGSNIAGTKAILMGEFWWAPSRVIVGGINEFPAWSFLLGDLHPHFLNLPLFPLLLSCYLSVRKNYRQFAAFILSGVLLLLGLELSYSANAWEVPIVGLLLGSLILIPQIKPTSRIVFSNIPWRAVLTLLIGAAVLLPGILNIHSPHAPFTFVRFPIPKTRLDEIFWHWGLPLALLTFTTILRSRGIKELSVKILFLGYALGVATEALSYLFILTLCLSADLFVAAKKLYEEHRADADDRPILISMLAISSVVLVMIPEVVFVNDAYGAESERMNTIFKIYAATWFSLNLSAMYLFSAEFMRYFPRAWYAELRRTGQIVLLLIVLPFFINTATKDRPNRSLDPVLPKEEGLTTLRDKFPGMPEVIRFLRPLGSVTVLEGQGPPYSETAHVSTLSAQYSYLGWLNHLNLLYPDTPEIGRRDRVVQKFYGQTSCDERKQILASEKIGFAVFGPLEKLSYPQLTEEDFKCLETVLNSGSYLLVR